MTKMTTPTVMRRPSLSSLSSLSSFLTSVVDFIYPETCGGCKERLEGKRYGIFCRTCWATLKPLTPPWCAVCGVPYDGLRQGETCGACLGRVRAPVAAWRCGASYEGVMRAAIHAFKYHRRRRTGRALSEWFERQLMAAPFHEAFEDVDVVMPVPLHRERERERRFNQARKFAGIAARWLRKPEWEGLERAVLTQPQSQLTRAERFVNVRKAFAVASRRTQEIQGKTILVVDDIVTTGATAEACARALKAAGAKSVKVLALARSL